MNRTLVYIGDFGPPTSTPHSYAYAFERNGWKVERVDQADAHRYGPDYVAQACEGANAALLLYTRTHNHTAIEAQWTDLWRALEARGTKTASVHLDVFWGIPEREDWIANGDSLFSTGTVFTADGRVESERKFFEAGVNHVWLPPAIDERNLLPADTRFEPCEGLPPIVWVGSSRYHVEWPWREELVDFLRREYGGRLVEFGNGSPQGSCRDNATLTSLYASDTIVMGDSMFSGDDENRYWSDRVPEVLGRGGFLIHPLIPYPPGTYCSYPPALYVLRTLLDSPILSPGNWETRQRMKHKGAAHVRAQETYTHRAASILSHLGLDVQVPA